MTRRGTLDRHRWSAEYWVRPGKAWLSRSSPTLSGENEDVPSGTLRVTWGHCGVLHELANSLGVIAAGPRRGATRQTNVRAGRYCRRVGRSARRACPAASVASWSAAYLPSRARDARPSSVRWRRRPAERGRLTCRCWLPSLMPHPYSINMWSTGCRPRPGSPADDRENRRTVRCGAG